MLVCINDLEEMVTGKLLKFANDTNPFRQIKEIGDKYKLQDDIDKLVRLSENGRCYYVFGKCEWLHVKEKDVG